jgi:hypothetical protein
LSHVEASAMPRDQGRWVLIDTEANADDPEHSTEPMSSSSFGRSVSFNSNVKLTVLRRDVSLGPSIRTQE